MCSPALLYFAASRARDMLLVSVVGGGIGIVACGAHLLCPPWAMGFAAGQLEYSNCPYLQQAFTTQFMRQGGVDRGVAERMPDVL